MVSIGEARPAVVARHLAAGDGADDAVDVDDGQLELHLLAALDRGLTKGEEMRVVEGLVETVVLRFFWQIAYRTSGPTSHLWKTEVEVDALGFPVIGALPRCRGTRRDRPSR
jgi:hypothetical protein